MKLRARFTKGMIEPLEPIDLPEGQEITIKILDAFEATAGAWKDSIDCEELIRNIYADRLIPSERPVPRFEKSDPVD